MNTYAQPETPGKCHVYVAFNRRMGPSNTRTTKWLNHSKWQLNNIPRIILIVLHSSRLSTSMIITTTWTYLPWLENRVYLGRVSLGRVQLERVLLGRWNGTASIWNASSWHVIIAYHGLWWVQQCIRIRILTLSDSMSTPVHGSTN